MDFLPLLSAIALMWKIVDFVKHVRVRDINAVVTQLAVWGAGVLVTFLLAGSDFAEGVSIGDTTLGALNAASVVLVGLCLGASASVGYDFKRSLDNSDSAAQPALVTGEVPITPPMVVDSDAPVPKPPKRAVRKTTVPGDGGYGLVELLLIIAGVVLLVVGVIDLIVAAVGKPHELSVGGLILAIVGAVLCVFARALGRPGPIQL